MPYTPNPNRYESIPYRRCGHSGLLLPALSLGLWHNFGHVDTLDNARRILHVAFDRGVTHFDLANNYGPPPGSAEENFGRILHDDFRSHRDELVISTKAGYRMGEGPYNDGGSRKYLMASLDQSLKRMGLDYVDIFYHHRPDSDTPLEETMQALHDIVRQGKALYVGLSNYSPDETSDAVQLLRQFGTACLIHQPRYSLFDRQPETGLLDVLADEGVGCIPFSPLAQGLLTNKYLRGVPADSRAAKPHGALPEAALTKEKLDQIRQFDKLAKKRGQSLAQMALAWVLKDPRITSALIGVSRPEQLTDSLKCLANLDFEPEELSAIDAVLNAGTGNQREPKPGRNERKGGEPLTEPKP